MILTNWLWKSRRTAAALALYNAVVRHARAPDFYLRLGVPDTVDGRFDMIALHVYLVLRRLGRADDEDKRFAQALFDAMFMDLDRNLREMGAGDLGIGRKVKGLAAAFYGRIQAYDAGLEAGDGALDEALRRNLFRKSKPASWQVAAMTAYLQDQVRASEAWETPRLRAGEVAFGPPPEGEGA